MNGFGLFVREALSHPIKIGAACPSSKKLSRSIAEQIPSKLNGLLIELGAGTGAITQALLDHDIPTNKIIIIERSKKLMLHLFNRFPQLKIIQGDACELSQLLAFTSLPIKIIVSSLPLRNLPKKNLQRIGQELDKLLAPSGLFIQYTYSLWSNPLPLSTRLHFIYSKYVLWNIPPARIDIYCAK